MDYIVSQKYGWYAYYICVPMMNQNAL